MTDMFKGDLDLSPFSSGQLTKSDLSPKARIPKLTLLTKAEQLARSRFKCIPLTVCMLVDQEETAHVRGAFHGDIKDRFWQQLQYIATNTGHCTDQPVPFHDDIVNTRSTIYGTMDLHHVVPVSLCPVSLYPNGDWRDARWEDVIEWWRTEAHTRLAAIPRMYHNEIHAVQDGITMLELGVDALKPERKSRAHVGQLNIIMKNSAFWLPQQNVISSLRQKAGVQPPSSERRRELLEEARKIQEERDAELLADTSSLSYRREMLQRQRQQLVTAEHH